MWTLDKLNQLINDSVEENVHLDFKGAGSISRNDNKKAEISKDVSAFANSDGGTIIYGLKEFDERSKRHLPERIDSIDGAQFSKEWLEQVINSSISPRITNITITPIQVEDPIHNKVVFVVDIPKGVTAHQAKDKRYYRRFNFESQMMDDWEIKDIINRQIRTNIRISFEQHFDIDLIDKLIAKSDKLPLSFEIWANNEGNKVAQYLDCFIGGKDNCAKYFIKPTVSGESFQYYISNEIERKITIGESEFVIGIDRIPILPFTSKKIGDLKIKSGFILDEAQFTIQVATEDSSKFYTIKGREILTNKIEI